MTPFSNLPLSSSMLANLNELGFTGMTPIQAQSLPYILEGKDLIAQAKTGSGKTAAFGLGVLTHLDVTRFSVQVLILCPTRELADQVAKELRRLARAMPNTKILTLAGGVAFGPQLGSLKHGAHIIVGTPGRIHQHLKKGSLILDALKILVLDEADRMLDMGFIEEIQEVLVFAPKTRQTLLFSATYEENIMELSRTVQHDPIVVKSTQNEVPNPIAHHFYRVTETEKLSALIALLGFFDQNHALVFCNTKQMCADVADALFDRGIDALAIHGDLEQYERTDRLVQFANGSCSVLVATDVAARGIDIKELGMVVNFDLPFEKAVYTHRIGRTGRAGQTGIACSLVDMPREWMEEVALEHLPKVPLKTLHAPNTTLVIEAGKKAKIRPGDLLGALTQEAGIPNDKIGKIDIFERQSYVAIATTHIKEAHLRLKQGTIKGRKFSVWILGS